MPIAQDPPSPGSTPDRNGPKIAEVPPAILSRGHTLRRDLGALSSKPYDLVVVGGGVFGLCAAWEATLRGLSVALIEKGDFAREASANCFQILHGGIRYLQHLDLVRVRQSLAERGVWMRIAPHLSAPLPVFMPSYGHGRQGRELLALGARLYDLVGLDRNRGIRDAARRIPTSRVLSRRQALELHPQLEHPALTGGVVFHDGHMQHPARLALAFLLSASRLGAQAANYVEATQLLRSGARVHGVRAVDRLGDQSFEIRGRMVLNATGGWIPGWLAAEGAGARSPCFTRDAYFVLRRPLPGGQAMAVGSPGRDPDAVPSRSGRQLFLLPRGRTTLVGVWHEHYSGDPDRARIGERELRGFLDEVDALCPWLGARREDVALLRSGLVLAAPPRSGREPASMKRGLLVDHERSDGLPGLVSLVGPKYTTARWEAERAIDLICRKLAHSGPPSRSATLPLLGGDFESFPGLLEQARKRRPEAVPETALEALVRNHGSQFEVVLEAARRQPQLAACLPGSSTLAAELLHAVEAEMAVRLEDAVFGRTELGSDGHPGRPALEAAADLMAAALGWDSPRRSKELERCEDRFPRAGCPEAPVEGR